MFRSAPAGYSIAAPPSLRARLPPARLKKTGPGRYSDVKTNSQRAYDALMGALALMPLMLLYIGLSHFEQAPAHHINDQQCTWEQALPIWLERR